jgi:hypothetical protein
LSFSDAKVKNLCFKKQKPFFPNSKLFEFRVFHNVIAVFSILLPFLFKTVKNAYLKTRPGRPGRVFLKQKVINNDW